jgi:hypothetical protein
LKALDLAPEMIPVHPNVETAYELLTALLSAVCRFGKEDQSRACAPSRFPSDSGNRGKFLT